MPARRADPNLELVIKAQAAAQRRQVFGNVLTSLVQASAANPQMGYMVGIGAGSALNAGAEIVEKAATKHGYPLDLKWTKRAGVGILGISGIGAAGEVLSDVLEKLSPGGSSSRTVQFDIPDVPPPDLRPVGGGADFSRRRRR